MAACLDIDVVETNAEPSDHLQPGRVGEKVIVDPGPVADQKGAALR
jgi:hypothetical protein